MVSCLGSPVQSRCGEGGALQTDTTGLCGQHSPRSRHVCYAAQAARSLRSALCPGAERLIPSALPASVSARSGWVHLVSVLGSWSLAAALPADVHHPESQKVFGSKLEACLQFGRGCRLWGRVCPFPLPPASCLQRGMGRSTALFSGIAQSFLCS